MTGKTAPRLLTVLLTASLLLTFNGTLLAAQDQPADNTRIVLEKIRADKKLVVAQNLNLTEGEAKKFWPIYDRYQDELYILRYRTAQLIKNYADSYDSMTNDKAKKLLDEYLDIETLRLKLRKSYLPQFRSALPPVKVLRYYQIENKIGTAVDYEVSTHIPLAQ